MYMFILMFISILNVDVDFFWNCTTNFRASRAINRFQFEFRHSTSACLVAESVLSVEAEVVDFDVDFDVEF